MRHDLNAAWETATDLVSVDVGTFVTMEIASREMILNPIIPTQGLTMLFSPRGVGKTFVGLSIGVAVASGGSCLRWQAPKSRRVLFVDGEMPAIVMQERLKTIIRGSDSDIEDFSYLKLVTPDIQPNVWPDISSVEGQEAIERHLDGAEFLILDNLSTLSGSLKENEGDSWTPVQT